MKLVLEPKAWEQFLYRQETDRAALRKVNALIKDSLRQHFGGTGKPEPLKGDVAGLWSRRIDREHRLVCRVKQGALEIVTCRYHYTWP